MYVIFVYYGIIYIEATSMQARNINGTLCLKTQYNVCIFIGFALYQFQPLCTGQEFVDTRTRISVLEYVSRNRFLQC